VLSWKTLNRLCAGSKHTRIQSFGYTSSSKETPQECSGRSLSSLTKASLKGPVQLLQNFLLLNIYIRHRSMSSEPLCICCPSRTQLLICDGFEEHYANVISIQSSANRKHMRMPYSLAVALKKEQYIKQYCLRLDIFTWQLRYVICAPFLLLFSNE